MIMWQVYTQDQLQNWSFLEVTNSQQRAWTSCRSPRRGAPGAGSRGRSLCPLQPRGRPGSPGGLCSCRPVCGCGPGIGLRFPCQLQSGHSNFLVKKVLLRYCTWQHQCIIFQGTVTISMVTKARTLFLLRYLFLCMTSFELLFLAVTITTHEMERN